MQYSRILLLFFSLLGGLQLLNIHKISGKIYIPLEIEICDIRTSLLDLEREYVDFVMNSEEGELSDEEMEGVWELIKEDLQNEYYLECLEEI